MVTLVVLLLSCLVALPAHADVMPDEVATCRGKTAGAPCTTPAGLPGQCIEISFSRPDYSQGVPPTYRPVKLLSCEATTTASARHVTALPWVGVGLAFLALLAALRTRRAPQPA